MPVKLVSATWAVCRASQSASSKVASSAGTARREPHQAKASAAELARGRIVRLRKRLEQARERRLVHADAGVGNRDGDKAAAILARLEAITGGGPGAAGPAAPTGDGRS